MSSEVGQAIDVLPNQSLKLTEVAVDDFAERQYAENDMINRYVRAMNYMEVALRRRSLFIPLLFSGSSGPLGVQDWHLSRKIKTFK